MKWQTFPLSVLALALSAAAQAKPTLLTPVAGYTLTQSGELRHFSSLAFEHGKVLATGDDALIKQFPDAVIVDGKHRVLLPGLIDAHGHVMGLGFSLRSVDLVGTTSLADALARVKIYDRKNPEARWLVGRGWNQEIWKLGRFPLARELDAVVSDKPVWLERVDGHAGWANSAALKLAGITAKTPDPAGGKIERNPDGSPSGVLVDGAKDLIEAIIPKPTRKEAALALDAALADMARVGLTSVHDAGIDADTYDLYKRYALAGRLSARIYAMIGGTGSDFDTITKDGPLDGAGHDMLTVHSVKLYADGALGSRGAALLQPYSDDPGNRGLLFHSPEEMTAMMTKALAKGYQVNVHAIGDRGNREVLDSFAAAYKAVGGENLRNRIEHAQVVSPEDIPRFVGLKLIASMQPTHATSDKNMAETRLGHERMAGAYAWQRFEKQGTVIAGGSDFPVESPNPFYGLHAAVTRQDHQNAPPEGWYKDEALNLKQALRAFTLDAAYAAHAEDRQGSLEPGKWADFILVDQDIFRIPPADIWKTQVLETWVGGRPVYARED